jgi:hypothetical protein
MAFACIQINAFYGLAANVCPVYCSGIKWCGKVIKAREGKELVDQMRGAVYAIQYCVRAVAGYRPDWLRRGLQFKL